MTSKLFKRALLVCACAMALCRLPASDLRTPYWRYMELGFKDASGEQRKLVDSLMRNTERESDLNKLALLLDARLLLVSGHAVEASDVLDRIKLVVDSDHPLLLYSYSEVKGNLLQVNQQWEPAKEHALRALKYAQAFSLDKEEVDAHLLLAVIARKQNFMNAALQHCIDAEKRATAIAYAGGLSKVMIIRSNIHFKQGRTALAHQNYRKAFHIAIAQGYTQHVKIMVGNLAATLQENPDSLEAAITMYRQAIGIATTSGDFDLEAELRANMGQVMTAAGRPLDALVEIRSALRFFVATSDSLQLVHALYYMAEAQASLDRRDSALANAEVSLDLAVRAKNIERIVDCELLISRLKAAAVDKSLEAHIGNYARSRDSLEKLKMNAEIAEKEVQFETEKTEIELAKTALERDKQTAIKRRREIQLMATAAISALLIFLSFILYRNLRQRKRLAKKERELYEQQMGDVMRQSEIRSLDSLMQGQEMERKRVAKDLHDRLGSMLSAIKLQFGALEGKVETVREENKQQYRHVTTLLDDAVGEVRRISHDMLKSSLAQFGLGGALDDLRQALSAPGKLDVEMTLFGLEERMEQKIEIAAFRMVQECVSNALKHAKATAITISVTRTTGALNVMVEDNGKGFDMSQVSEGMGLGNLRQRAAEVGGAVQFDSSPGYGTTVTIDVPLA
ncbi:MAG: sensor histidine kinase [Flavobacteriales bacterium]|nr:sensor histidine kinase [Flavobacteriales bacterium]